MSLTIPSSFSQRTMAQRFFLRRMAATTPSGREGHQLGGWLASSLRHALARVIEPGRVINDICSLQDFIPTFAAAAGKPDLVAKVKKGYKIGAKTFKVHLDGFNLLPFLAGKDKESPREGFLWSDDGELMALRINQYKVVFSEQRSTGLDVWREPLSKMRIPKLFDLRSDPFERGEESNLYYAQWFVEHVPLQYACPGTRRRMA